MGPPVEREITKGIVEMIRNKEFYAHIVQQMEKVFVGPNHVVDTAAVGRMPGERFIKMYINTGFIEKILAGVDARKVIVGLMEHEVLHVVLQHLFMKLDDRERAAVAKDLTVNSYIEASSLPAGALFPADYGLEAGKSALWYYTHLKGNEKFEQQRASGCFSSRGLLYSIMRSHSMWKDFADDPVAQEIIRDIVRVAKEMCGGSYGDVPAGVIEQMDDLMRGRRPIVRWEKMLRMFAASCMESILEHTKNRISRRFGTRPGTRKADVIDLAVAVDTSGSISKEQIVIFFNEIRWLWKNGAKVTIYEADCQVCSVYPFSGQFNGKIHGRGGTDLEPVLKVVEGKHDALIYFTDFIAPKITKRYSIPTLWVLHTGIRREDFPVRWGRHIRIETGRAVAA
jgi:predicted metal-dependent peptidase